MVYRVGCCWFWLTAAPFVAKLSGAVRAMSAYVKSVLFPSGTVVQLKDKMS
ncbi:hypothetical protein GTN09_004550 [Salmonella enterica]|nr:hypothetical protein [Salmonella enterica subsp. enterica serovar Montevideo]EDY3486554.1 hypothetical protein [Salmonella enterica]